MRRLSAVINKPRSPWLITGKACHSLSSPPGSRCWGGGKWVFCAMRSFSCTPLFKNLAPSFLWCHRSPPGGQGCAAGAESRGSRVACLGVRPGHGVCITSTEVPLARVRLVPTPGQPVRKARSAMHPEEAELGAVRAPCCACGRCWF